MNDALGYLTERLGVQIPATMGELGWALLRGAKREGARWMEYRAQQMEAEAMMAGSVEDQIEAMKEAKQWGVVAQAIRATDIELPQPPPQPPQDQPKRRKVKVYVEEDDGDEGPQDG